MALGPRLDIRQTQALVLTPQLQQAIRLLQLWKPGTRSRDRRGDERRTRCWRRRRAARMTARRRPKEATRSRGSRWRNRPPRGGRVMLTWTERATSRSTSTGTMRRWRPIASPTSSSAAVAGRRRPRLRAHGIFAGSRSPSICSTSCTARPARSAIWPGPSRRCWRIRAIFPVSVRDIAEATGAPLADSRSRPRLCPGPRSARRRSTQPRRMPGSASKGGPTGTIPRWRG